MKKKIFFLVYFLVIFFAFQNVVAQTKYLTHTVMQGESLSLIASKYKTTVGDIMRFNGMDNKSVLIIGRKLKIPPSGVTIPRVAGTAKTVVAKPKADSVLVKKPVVENAKPIVMAVVDSNAVSHVVTKGESLYSLSKKFNVSVVNLVNWNKLTDDDIKLGQVLIVSAVRPTEAKQNIAAEIQPTLVVPNTVTPEPAVHKDSVLINVVPQIAEIDTSVSKIVNELPVVVSDISGYFSTLFGKNVAEKNLQTTTGTSMTFTKEAAVPDKKYYILMNGAAPGSIVQISNDNKTIYAKVLWKLDAMKENEGLLFRISNDAAFALGINDSKFELTVTFYE